MAQNSALVGPDVPNTVAWRGRYFRRGFAARGLGHVTLSSSLSPTSGVQRFGYAAGADSDNGYPGRAWVQRRFSAARGRNGDPDGPSDEQERADAQPDMVAEELTLLDKVKLNAPKVVAGIGGLVAVYGVTKTVMFITSGFMKVNFTTVGMIGFAAGFSSAAMCAGGAYAINRALTIRPERAFRHALAAIAADPEVIEHLGDTVQSGKLRAYTIRQGSFGLSPTKALEWLPPRVQMLFQVVGDKRYGMATVEAEKRGTRIHLNLVTVDAMDQRDDTTTLIFVAGDRERLSVRGQLRGFLQSERVRYMAQDVPDSMSAEEVKMETARETKESAEEKLREAAGKAGKANAEA